MAMRQDLLQQVNSKASEKQALKE
jgi:hypothetical protein